MNELQHKPTTNKQFEETPFMNDYNSPTVEKPKKKPPTWQENVSSYFSQYCGATSVHGVQYVGERGRYLVEKIVWLIILSVVCYGCLTLILKTYNKWITSPVIVTIATTETSISEIPFPAVTICPEVKTDPEIFNYTDVLLRKVKAENVTEMEESFFQSFSVICNGVNRMFTGLGNVDGGSLTMDEDFIVDLLLAMPELDKENVSTLTWMQRDQSLDILTPSITSSGICYSFNMLNYNEILSNSEKYMDKVNGNKTEKTKKWTLEDGYPEGESIDTFPRRTFLSGINGGFTLSLITNDTHLDYLCGETLQGFQVTIHHPSELPNMDRHFRLPLDQAVMVAIKPRMITVSGELTSYKPEDRKCFFAHERLLAFYRSYTQQNCLDECYSNYTLTQCGCVPFYMPKEDASPICGPGSNDCIDDTKVNYMLHHADACKCLPPCTSLEYDIEISQTDFNWKGMFQVLSKVFDQFKQTDYEQNHMSLISVYYKEMQFLTNERNELYGSTDFFSNIGGLLGLFIGFSVTSIIEIIYFLTLRLICNIKKYGSAVWSGDEELQARLE